jgi:hypothetical protein
MKGMSMADSGGDRDQPQRHNSDVASRLFQMAPEQYPTDTYQADLLEQYKLLVGTAEANSARRQTANSFFLSLNTALVAFLGLVVGQENGEVPLVWVLAIAVAGLALSYTWYRLVGSYRGINSAKFRVVQALEQRLPAAVFGAEWEAVGRGKDPARYLAFTRVEQRVPWVFAALYSALALWHIVQALG